MSDPLVSLFGWPALVAQSDPLTFERWAWIRQRLPTDLTGQRVLDAGCGNGAFALWAAHRGAEVLGISDAETDTELANRRAVASGLTSAVFEYNDLRSVEHWGPGVGTFDHVICLEVIEHVLDDQALIRRLADRLRPGGTLLLSTPTDDHPALFGERAHLSGVEDGRHVRWGSSVERLRSVVGGAGLEVLRVDPIGGPVARALTSATYRGQGRSRVGAWAGIMSLRPLRVADPALLRWTSAKSHCWGVQAVKLG